MTLSEEIQLIKSDMADISLKMLYGKTAEEIVKEMLTNKRKSDNQCSKRKEAIR